MDIVNKGPLLVRRHGDHVAVVTLNRPEVHNAISAVMSEALERAVEDIEADSTIRVAVLSAAGGRSFCAGADLSEVAAGKGALIARPRTGFAGFVRAERTKPWIAAVDGAALGGGTEISLACDMIVAGDGARFGLPEVRRGIFAGAGGVIRLSRSVSRPIAMEMLTVGAPVTAARAAEICLINRVVPAGTALDEAIAMADQIADNAPIAVRESIRLLRLAADGDEPRLWEENACSRDVIVASEDAREGPRAFMEKRKPVWSGR
ncbi:enoyl-CoA hydratase-related protein [Rhizorhabdus wittichii]|uniref:enoyl-CoA hydratase-related protein n=1 Tax=Rhizorhabdus wittichii TaxID=160791 RepID=UPI0002F1D20F|nr:enoyl-CoA hydratase-related protein [Rhizorhabdus wittichii]